jgi:hypothetical protein
VSTATEASDDEQPGTTRSAPPVDELAGEIARPPRRPMAAGNVFKVMLIAALVGGLLNAAGIRKTALSQPVGWRRDLGTAIANPLYDVSHALHLDRLRIELKDLLGRSSDDKVNTSLPSPTTVPPTVPGPTPTTLPPREAYSPQHQLRLWVGGDSLAETPGQSLIDQAIATQAVGILGPVDTHVATGLARPEVFNWPDYLKTVLTADQPNAVVLTFGANDDQTLTGTGGGEQFGGADWQAEYGRRVGGLMDTITSISSHPRLFFVGIPPVRDMARFLNDYRLINNVYKSQAEQRPGRVYFVDTVPVLGTADGSYTDFLQRPDGTVVQVRSGDGIHFTRDGGDRVAAKVLETMRQAFDLDSWKTASSSTTTTTPTTTTGKAGKRTKGTATTTTTTPAHP